MGLGVVNNKPVAPILTRVEQPAKYIHQPKPDVRMPALLWWYAPVGPKHE
jgi:hypothetical protein